MSNLFDLSKRQALVTGGAQGLGRMIAEGLLKAGASVAITSRKEEVAAEAAKSMSEHGTCIPIAADLSTAEGAIALADSFKARVGCCNILVNNAGRSWGAPLESFPAKAWPGIMTINVQVPFTLSRELLPLMRETASDENPSRIVNIGSIAGNKVDRLSAFSYTASKAAIQMLSREMAAEFAQENLTVNTLVPGYFPTKMTKHLREGDEVNPETLAQIPMGRFGKPDEIAGATIFLCSRAGAYVTGAALPVDGGILGCT